MRKVFAILSGLFFTFLCTSCEQFTSNIDTYLSYWAAEVSATGYSIDQLQKPYPTNKDGVLYIPSTSDVTIAIDLRNPKNFTLVMPNSSSSYAGKVIRFPGFKPDEQPGYGTDYTLTQTANDRLTLTYTQAFLQRYEWGTRDIGPEITFITDDPRVFRSKFSLNLKVDTAPALEYAAVGKTAVGTDDYYVLLFRAKDMNTPITDSSVHKDLNGGKLIITKSGGSPVEIPLSFNAGKTDFEASADLLASDVVQKLKLSDPELPSPTSQDWILRVKTDVKVDGPEKLYEVCIKDKQGVSSAVIRTSTKKNKLPDVQLFDGSTEITGTSDSNPKGIPGIKGKTLTAKAAFTGTAITGTVYKQSGGAWIPISGGTVSGTTTAAVNLPALAASGTEALYKISLKAQLSGYDDSDSKDFFVKLLWQEVPVLKLKQNFSSGDINLHCISAGTKAYVTEDIIPDAGQYTAENPLLIYTAPFSNFKLELSASAGTAVKYKLGSGAEQSPSAPAEITVIGGTVYPLEVWTERGGIPGLHTTVYIKGFGTLNTYSELKNVVKNAPENGTGPEQYDYSSSLYIFIGSDLAASAADTEIAVTDGKKLMLLSSSSGTVGTVNAGGNGRIFKVSGAGTMLTLSDLQVTGGYAADGKGGAVCVEAGGALGLDDKTVITPSTGADINTPGKNDVYLANGTSIKVDSTLTTTEPIVARITPQTYSNGNTVLTGHTVSTEYTKFSVTQPAGSTDIWTIKSDGTLQAIPTTINSGSGAWQKLKEAVQTLPEGSTITINGTITATKDGSGETANWGEIEITKNLTIKGKTGANSDMLNANRSVLGADAHRIFNVANGKTLTLQNLTLKNGQGSGSTGNGGAVYTKGGSVEMTLCTLIGNEAGNGGAVYAEKDGSTAAAVTLKGCTIGGTGPGNANAAAIGSDREGGGIYIGEGCTLTLENSGATGCTVKGNNALRGGGIYVAGTAEIKGTSKILNNTADHFGGGIHSEGTLTLSGDALIKDNSASDHTAVGGGVYVGNGTFTMSDRATVTPSTGEKADKPRENDVYLNSTTKIKVDGTLNPEGGTAARITIPDNKYLPTTQVLIGSITDGTSPNQNYTKFAVTPQTLSDGKILYWEADASGKLMRIVDGVKYPDKAWKALKDVVSVAGTDPITINGRIQATDDADNKGTININGAITIKGKNGRDTDILDAGKKGGRIFIINDTLSNKLTLEKLTLKGGFVNGNDGAAILVGRDAEAELSACTIEECEALNGGAIAILATGTATLTNTDIKNCSAKLFSGNTPPNGSGGAVYAAGGTVIMTNCTLTGNTAENNGGAVYAKKTSDLTPILSTVTIEGGTIGGAGTNANKATGTGEGLGGGIYIGESCVLNMKDYTDSSNNKHGAKVISNTAKAKGGAIYTKGGKVTMTNCTLKGNEAKSGGAICAEKDGSTSSNVTISGGTIGGTGADANKATGTDSDNGFGGAVFIKGAIVTLNGCTLEGNKAKNGGGVYMEGGNCTLNGSLKNNTTTEPASSYGGSIYLENGTLTMKTGAEISGSEASVSGGGVYISARDGGTASFTMEGGTISGCKVSSAYFVDGGGVCVEVAHGSTGTANFIMQGGSITGCKVESGGLSGSPSGGGVCVKNGATFDMTGGSITGCKAEINHNAGTPESQGGGVYMENSTFNMSGSSSITGCTAESSDSDISGSPSFYGGGVYAAGSTATFTMKDSAVITPSSEVPSGMKRFNDVYLNSGAKITVAGSLTPPGGIAARITPAAYNTTTQVLTAGTGVTLANETYKFAVTPQIVSGTPWTVDGNGRLKQGRYTEVPYGKLAAFLANASENEVNYIEVTGISAADLTGTYASPPNPGPLGALLNNNSSKKVALKLPNSISGLTDMSACFSQCENLVSLENFPSGVTDMRACFYGCENLTTVPAIPATVTSMMECFRYCRSLTTVPNIPSGVYDMTRCFQYCKKLQSIKMNCPYGVNFNGAFSGCDALPNGGIQVPSTQLGTYKANAGTMGTTRDKFAALP